MTLERQALFWALAAAFVAAALYLLSGVLLPFVAALALGYLLDPVADRLQRFGLSRLGATLVILGVFVVVLALGLILLAPLLASQLAGFVEALPRYLSRLQKLISEEGGQALRQTLGGLAQRLGLDGSLNNANLQGSLEGVASKAAAWLATLLASLWSGGSAIVGLISLLVVTPVVAFYILLDWDRMVATIDSYLPLDHRETIRALARDIDAALAGFLRGQSLVCLFLGLWYGLGLTLIGLDYGFLIGVSAGVLSFIPYVGSLTALIVSLAVALVQGWPGWTLPALALAVVGTGQFLEGNFLTPRLVGHSIGLHPVWLMFALFAFGALFGFTGLIAAVPVAAALGVLIRHGLRRYRESPVYRGAQG